MRKAVSLGVAVGLLAALVAGCGRPAHTSVTKNTVFTTIDENHGITVGAPINPFNPNGNTFNTYDKRQLAYFTNSASNPNAFWPALAQRWQLTNGGQSLTVWLQPNAKWSNGEPVTAQDVKTSAAIWFTQGTAQTFDLGSVKVLGSKEVQFNELPRDHLALFLHRLLPQIVVPASVFGHLLPSNIWQTIAIANGSNASAAAAATKTLTALGQKISAFAPKQDVSAGPFVLSQVNAGEAILTKNPYFYDASRIQVDKVVMRNYTGNQQIWNYLLAGQLDFTPYTSMPSNIYNEVKAKPGNVKVVATSYVGWALAFNEHIYPYGSLIVRKAIAHIINRSVVQKLAEPTDGTVNKWSDGMVDTATQQWMTKAQLSQLRQYRYSPQRATRELTQAGFHKVNGKWMMPNGKPWTATIYTVNGFSNWIEAAHVMASEMTSFGIPTHPVIVSSYSAYLSNLAAGKYALGYWIMGFGPSPHAAFNAMYGQDDGYNLVGGRVVHYSANNPSQGNWLDTPVPFPAPGGGTMNPGRLTNDLSNTTSASIMRPIVQKLILATNAQLPMVTIVNLILVQWVNTSRFTDLPVHNGNLLLYPAGLWMMLGYVHPK